MKQIEKKKIFGGIVCGVYLLLFYAFMYSDILITTSHGINLWDILFDGKLLDFYKICTSDVNNAAYEIYNIAGYDFLIYIVFAIWNFPLWVARRFFEINIWESALAMMWAKSLLLLFTVLSAYSMVKICRTLSFERKRIEQTVMLFGTSSLLFSCVFVMSQYDIMYLFLMLEAFNCFLKKQLKGFTFYMALALPFKPISLFLFAPLLLYKEKNIFKICVHTISVLLPWIALKIVFSSVANDAYMGNVLIMFRTKIQIANVEIPLYVLAVLLLYFLCYILQTPQDEKQFQLGSLRIAFVAYAMFFMICGGNPYWLILLVPFQCLLIMANEKSAYVSVVVETITSLCLVASHVWLIRWLFDVRLLKSTYVVKLFGERNDNTNNILDIIQSAAPSLYDLAIDSASGLLFGVFFAGTCVFAWLNCGRMEANALEAKEIPNYIFGIRLALGIGICLLPVVAYVF